MLLEEVYTGMFPAEVYTGTATLPPAEEWGGLAVGGAV